MKKKELNQKVNRAFRNATPDLRDSILQNTGTVSDNIVAMPRRRSAVRWVAGIAAALVLVTGLVAGGVFYGRRNTAVSTVSLDVNPSVSITLNREERVLAVEGRNEEGRAIIGDMDFKGSDVDVAINALIGSMLRNGYLSEVANSILLSVDDPDPAKGADLQSRLTTAINELLQTNTFSGAVLSQTLSPDEELQKLADSHGISRGKAQLIRQITSQNTLHTFEELAPLSINELNLISESGGLHLENVQAVGTASNQAYIGEQKALEAAAAHAGVPAGETTRVEWEMDYERGKMVYELDFDHGDYEYEYDIDATTGEVLKNEREPKKQRPATNNTTPGNSTTTPSNNSTTPSNSTTKNNTTTATPTGSGKDIGEEAAKQAALTHAGVKADAISRYTCKRDRDDGRVVYEIEFFANGYEYDYDIDATTGEVLKSERDTEKSKNPSATAPAPTQPAGQNIGEDKAKEAALSHAKVTADKATGLRVELDRDDGRTVYEVEFRADGYEYEYELDATTGDVLKYDRERDD